MINSFLDKLEENNLAFYFYFNDSHDNICFIVDKKNVDYFESNFNEADLMYFLELLDSGEDFATDEFINDWISGFGVKQYIPVITAYSRYYKDKTIEKVLKSTYDVIYKDYNIIKPFQYKDEL